MGWWGPIAKKTGVDSGGLRPILIGLGTAVVGTTAVAASNRSLGSTSADALYSFSAAAIENSGAQISNLLLGSPFMLGGSRMKVNDVIIAEKHIL